MILRLLEEWNCEGMPFLFYYVWRGFLVQLRDERKEELGLSLELGGGEIFLL